VARRRGGGAGGVRAGRGARAGGGWRGVDRRDRPAGRAQGLRPVVGGRARRGRRPRPPGRRGRHHGGAADIAHGRRAARRIVHIGRPVRGPARGGGRGRLTRGALGEAARPRRWRLVRARGEAVPPSVRLFTARARRRRWRAARPWLVALGVLSLVGGVLAVLYATPLLGVAEVRVVGARLVSVDDVRRAAAVRPGTPLARVDIGAVARR